MSAVPTRLGDFVFHVFYIFSFGIYIAGVRKLIRVCMEKSPEEEDLPVDGFVVRKQVLLREKVC